MKEATFFLKKIRSAALRRLLWEGARRCFFVACLSAFLARIDVAFWNGSPRVVWNVYALVVLSYAIFLATRLRSRVPTLYQTARRLESNDAELQGILSASLEFESARSKVASDSPSLRKETTTRARIRLENAFADGRARELTDCALRRQRDARRNRVAFLEQTTTLGAAVILLAVSFMQFAPNEKTPETTSSQVVIINELETSVDYATNENAKSNPTSTALYDEIAFLRASLARSASLAKSLTRELNGTSFDSFDSTLVFQLSRELDLSFTSPQGLASSVGRVRTSLVRASERDVVVFLLDRRLNEFNDYLSQNLNVGAELARLFATSIRSVSRDVQSEAFESALETLRQTRERLQAEESALVFLSFGWEYSHKIAELEQERDALLQGAIERLKVRPGVQTDVAASNLPTDEFLIRLDAFERLWNDRRDELVETARRLRAPNAKEFVDFVARIAQQTDSYSFFFGVDGIQVDLTGRFERLLLSTRQIARNARAERWGKAATTLSETPRARDMLGDDMREEEDCSSTLAWRLAFGTFDGAKNDLQDLSLISKKAKEQTFKTQDEFKIAKSLEEIQETLERTPDKETSASVLSPFPDETQTKEKTRASFNLPLRSDKTSEENAAPDGNYAGGASSRETGAPIKNAPSAFQGELPIVAQKRLEAGKRWNPPPEYREKERAFQTRLTAETRKKQIVRAENQRVSDAASK